jgi:DNA-binding response OmpR family regulator
VKVLLVDGNTDLLDVTTYALRRHGYVVLVATNGKEALRRWENEKPDVVVLDYQLTSISGLEVCRAIRQQCATPVIFLIEDPTDDQIRQSRVAGANDYLAKPLHPRELAERIEALALRAGLIPRRMRLSEPVGILTVGDLTLDTEMLQAWYADQSARLTKTEFRLLYLLALNAGQVIATEQLGNYAIGSLGVDTFRLRVHMSHLRRKLQLPHRGPNSIVAVPRVGYLLEGEAPKSQSA